MSKADILAEVLKIPDLTDADQTHLNLLIDNAVETVISRRNVSVFPFLSQGTSTSGASPSTDLQSEANNTFWISIDGSLTAEIELTLANCDSGSNTAAEMQTQIRDAFSAGSAEYDLFSRVTVAYADSLYVITSPTYGNRSRVRISWEAGEADVAAALKLSAAWAGVELPGASADAVAFTATVRLVENAYRRYLMAPEIYEDTPQAAVARAYKELDELTRGQINSGRGFSFP